MIHFTALSSGSKGNSSLLSTRTTTILIDAGLNCRELFRRLYSIGQDPTDIDAIVITHEHSDHIAGMATTARKLGIPVYLTEPTYREWVQQSASRVVSTYTDWLASIESPETQFEFTPRSTDLPEVHHFQPRSPFQIGNISVTPFSIPHDAIDPVGFLFNAEGKQIAFATDLGHVSPDVEENIRNCDLLVLESNHDIDMLENGEYAPPLKERVASDTGHLSNSAVAEFLSRSWESTSAWIVLAHLSASNNTPELARMSAQNALAANPRLLENKIMVASQDRPTMTISLES